MLATLGTIGLVILGIIVLIGFIRVLFAPYTGFANLIMECFMLDLLGDILSWIADTISDWWD